MCFLMVDYQYNFSVLSLYHTAQEFKDRIQYGDEVLIRNPTLNYVSMENKGKIYSYPSIKVTNITDILINKETIVSEKSEG